VQKQACSKSCYAHEAVNLEKRFATMFRAYRYAGFVCFTRPRGAPEVAPTIGWSDLHVD
jgi:hypothetical protein